MTTWREDVLGEGYECTELDLGSDDEGPLAATLVRRLAPHQGVFGRLFHGKHRYAGVDVLYIHGWSDYFFQASLAEFYTERGANFYALDLRKYGRSLRAGQTPGYVLNLDEYDQEIGLALEVMGYGGPGTGRKLLLLGHSTGGLVLSLWAGRNPGRADALVLNSPWLEFQLSSAGRTLLAPIIGLSARIAPREAAPQMDYGIYSRAQKAVGPERDLALVNKEWRPDRSHLVPPGWLNAVLEGHAQVERGLGISAPVLVMVSERSAVPLRWNDELAYCDTVLDVGSVARASLRLGHDVTVKRIEGGLHDLFLSAQESRTYAFAAMERWVDGWIATAGSPAALATAEPPRRHRVRQAPGALGVGSGSGHSGRPAGVPGGSGLERGAPGVGGHNPTAVG